MSLVIYATEIGTGEIIGYLSYDGNTITIQNPMTLHLNPSLPGGVSSEYLWTIYTISSSMFTIGVDDFKWTEQGSSFVLKTNGTVLEATSSSFNVSQLTFMTKLYTTSLQIYGSSNYVGIQNNQLIVTDQNTILFNFLLYIGDLISPSILNPPYCNNLISNISVSWIYSFCTVSVGGLDYAATYFSGPPTTTNNIPVINSKENNIPVDCAYISYSQDSDSCYSNFQGITVYDCNMQTQYLLTINTEYAYPTCNFDITCLSIQASFNNESQSQYVNINNQTQNYLLVQGRVPVYNASASLTPFQFYIGPHSNTNLSLSSYVNICNNVQLQDSAGDVYNNCLGFGTGQICELN